jgi:hypothetical protein
VPIEEIVSAVADMVKAGYVRFIGLSEMGAETIRRARDLRNQGRVISAAGFRVSRGKSKSGASSSFRPSMGLRKGWGPRRRVWPAVEKITRAIIKEYKASGLQLHTPKMYTESPLTVGVDCGSSMLSNEYCQIFFPVSAFRH